MKIGIVTIIDNNNYGNRLQNFALQEYLKKNFECHVFSFRNYSYLNNKNNFIINILKHLKYSIANKTNQNNKIRKQNFNSFNKYITFYPKLITAFSKIKKINFVICGSDQIWNPEFNRFSDLDLLCFVEGKKRIAYAASFGISNLNKQYNKKILNNLSKFKSISVREDSGKNIINGILNDKEVSVLIDPTMLLTDKDWDSVSKKPKMINTNKYILNYFLGELSEERKNEIDRVAEENNCEVINILDKSSPYYECGPSEFLWLEKNAFLICTDSFHSSVFAILYNRPFIIFDREQEGISKMNSRLETLINKFKLKNRKFTGKITKENLNHDYIEAYKILEKERKKSKVFLEKALDTEK